MKKIVEKRRFESDPALNSFVQAVIRREQDLFVEGLEGASGSFVLALLFRKIKRTIIVVTESQQEAQFMYRDLNFFLDAGDVFLHPPWDLRLLSSDDMISFQNDVIRDRITALSRLYAGGPAVVIAPVESLVQRVMPVEVLGEYLDVISVGDTRPTESLVKKLLEGGYQRVSLVEDAGEFSLRGYILDVFPAASEFPLRLEFYGDDIESIKVFNPESQRSLKAVDSFIISTASEIMPTDQAKEQAVRNLRIRSAALGIPRQKRDHLAGILNDENGTLASAGIQYLPLYYDFFPDGEEPGKKKLDTLLDYVSDSGIVALIDQRGIKKGELDAFARIDRFLEKAASEERFHLEKGSNFISLDELFERFSNRQRIYFKEFGEYKGKRSFKIEVERTTGLKGETGFTDSDQGLLAPFVQKAREWLTRGTLIGFLSGEEESLRLEHLFQGYSLPVERSTLSFFSDMEEHDGSGRLVIKTGNLTEGFYYRNLNLALISQDDVFGKKIKRKRKQRAREGYFLKSFGELKEGDSIVHLEHGIGKYRGLFRLSAGGIENDFLLIEYLGGDKLYIPVDRLNQIQRYIGADGHEPAMDRLGGTSWDSVKKKVKESVRKIAEDLIALYAAREVMDGHSFSRHERYYEEFASSFEFEETPDQSKAIESVNEDMDDIKPMDRLICGDAGFGKTEVALRAAFRAAMDGKQVAMLVPTTILAEQHFRTFAGRFAEYPFHVEVLNRFKTKKEQNKIVADLNKGLVDIVIGTHRILQKDVIFKDLGLVIIDEEQRFGVAHKEKLKKLRTVVDVLTLTATPIPRTLQLSLAGLRDLSVIDTPPEGRREVKVYVAEFDESIIRDAIMFEHSRGGQVYFIHDRVRSIDGIAQAVRRIVPEINVGVAHGQMRTKELEDIMIRFLRKQIDVLICTTIVGSGVDIPAANTIIINRADRFGLSQLYQLRGRVGRSKEEAFAWLLIPKGAVLSKDARKRLRAAQEFSEPGSGFKVAAYDLEIRGAGNIVGISQSGHVSAVGYELYMDLMEQAVMEIRGEKTPEMKLQPEIHLGIAAFIPDTYIADTHNRLIIYKKMSMASSEEELDDIKEELVDRYGHIPSEADNLIQVIRLKQKLKDMGVKEMKYDGKYLSLGFSPDTSVDPGIIVELVQKKNSGMSFNSDNRLRVFLPDLDEKERVNEAGRIMNVLKLKNHNNSGIAQ
ncbi:MAG: transcription-repair coupling factor [Syntrophales bacterium]|jgi:transcription-repair coupling factor (superfamily II helicase)|nr:transcription-repair coupling factor [Syntrophales bacterium]MDY0045081.1 transcription-repair coupling factor [Syntrophales bacterium]